MYVYVIQGVSITSSNILLENKHRKTMDKPIEVFDEDDLCEFELRRQSNILANRDFMIQCGKYEKIDLC